MEPADDMQLEEYAEEGHSWASEAVALSQVRLAACVLLLVTTCLQLVVHICCSVYAFEQWA
jgi:hypothetical protein